MERTILLIAILLVTIWGCSEHKSTTEPVNQNNSSVAQSVTAEPNWIALPKPTFQSLYKGTGFIKTKLVEADKNTKLEIKDEYEGGPKGKVKLEVTIEFKKGTVAEDTFITMIFDTKTGVITFMPNMIFNKEARLELKYYGIDLTGVNEDDVNFQYLAPDGNYEAVDKRKIKVNIKKGEIILKFVKIPHFSYFGFTR